jgi:hypothetical protein
LKVENLKFYIVTINYNNLSLTQNFGIIDNDKDTSKWRWRGKIRTSIYWFLPKNLQWEDVEHFSEYILKEY